MNIPSELLFSKSHEWVRDLDGKTARIGLTDFAQHELGDLVFVNLPEVGDEAVSGEPIADVESVKAVSDVYSPLSGVVKAVNGEAAGRPELINSDPYGTWLVEIGDIRARDELLSAEEYAKLCKEED
ncbi:MAG: glycine cleavage system protein GcvH [Synergistaceae bacterium]|jgi:glycine cleavage system H protein|nr:glycine cleavage system protein GcvH [Synergistaceae bacterium]